MNIHPSDGFTRIVLPADLVPGVVIREIHPDGSIAPFSDMVILKAEYPGADVRHQMITLIRPMAWVSDKGEQKTHAEEFTTHAGRLMEYGGFRTVLLASGKPYTMQL